MRGRVRQVIRLLGFYPITRTYRLYYICILFALMKINKGFLLITWYQSTNANPNSSRHISSSSFLSPTSPPPPNISSISSAHCCLKRGCRGLPKTPPPPPKPSVIVEALGVITWCRRGLPKYPEPPLVTPVVTEALVRLAKPEESTSPSCQLTSP